MNKSYEIKFSELPYYLTVRKIIDEDNDIVSIEVESKIHVNRIIKLPTQYSIDFVRCKYNQFECEVLSQIIKIYGLKLQPAKFW